MARILVADDDPSILELARANLEGDHLVITVSDGADAINALRESAPDLAILDVMMPEVDGFEVLRRIRGNPDWSELPVIMLTARVSEDDYLTAWRSGADGYVAKPFEPEELEELINDVLSRSPAQRERIREQERNKASLLRRVEQRFSS